MQERDELVGGSVEGDFVDEADAGIAGLVELAGDVVGAKGDVVNAFSAGIEESCDGVVGRGWLEEFEVHFADGEHGGPDLLRFDLFDAFAGEAKGFFVVGEGGFDGANGDADVVDLGDVRGRAHERVGRVFRSDSKASEGVRQGLRGSWRKVPGD